MNCPICGKDFASGECKCSDEAVKEAAIREFQRVVYEQAMERERRKRKEFFDKIKRFFGIKTSVPEETDAK